MPCYRPPHLPPSSITPEAVWLRRRDVLKAALSQVFDRAKAKGVKALERLVIRPFDKSDALKLLPLVKSVPNATKRVELSGMYETSSGSEAQVMFTGDLDDATPVKDFLEPQFRAAADSDASVTYYLTFTPPLLVQGDHATRVIERLTRLVSPAAQVIAVPSEG